MIYQFIISGSVAFTYELFLGHYLEFVKIAKQTQPDKSYLQLTKAMIAKKGLAGAWIEAGAL